MTQLPTWLTVVAISIAANLIIGFCVVRLRRLNKSLQESERRHRLLVENAPYCIHKIDGEGKLASMNPAGLKMMGVTDESEIRGMPYLDSVGLQDKPVVAELLERAKLGEFSEFEFQAVNDLYFQSNFVPLDEWDDETEIMGITQDITERRQLEERLRAAQRLEAVGRLAGGIAHDFNNLLTVMIGHAQTLLEMPTEEGGLSVAARRHLEEIQSANDRAASLTGQLLAFGRRQTLEPEVVDINSVLSSVQPMLTRLIPENIRVDVHPSPTPEHVLVDRTGLEQAILNLCLNARDAMPAGGVLEVQVERRPAPIALTVGNEFRDHEAIVLTVRDDGHGIRPEDLEKIFDPFYTTKGVGEGSGLGLASTHGFVRQSGANITVDSNEDRGTTFRVYLPAQATPQAKSAPGSEILNSPSEPLTILLAEDEDSVRDVTSAMLRREGHTVHAAASPHTAIERATSLGSDLDLLITDLIMPEMDGSELARRLRDAQPRLKVLFVSGYSSDVIDNAKCSDVRANLLQKPFTRLDLLARIDEMRKDASASVS